MFKWINNLFSSNIKEDVKDVNVELAYYEMQIERDREHNKMMQELENKKIESYIKREARRWLFDRGIKIMTPEFSAIMIYDEETAKYKGADLRELVAEEYDRIKGMGIYQQIKELETEEPTPSAKLTLENYDKLINQIFEGK